MPSLEGLDAYAPKVATLRDSAVWVAFAQNPEPAADWGLRGLRPGLAPRPNVRAVLWSGGRWLSAPVQQPRRPGFVALGDMPDIVATGSGGVQVVMQRLQGHLNIRLWVSDLGPNGWSEPRELAADEDAYSHVAIPGAIKSRIDQRPSLVTDGSLIMMAYERGMGWAQNRQIAIREFAAAPDPVAESNFVPAGGISFSLSRPTGGDKLKLVPQVWFGDIHTHLLMDDGYTGTADQFYAFARDRRKLDFAAYTPHAECNKLIGAEVALVERIAGAFNEAGRFVAIPGWEWTQGDFKVPQEGHKHVLNETDGQPFFSSTETESDSAKELTRLMRGTSGIMFAHHVSRGLTGGTNYDTVDPDVEPDVEMCSHWGRFEYYQNPGHVKDELRGSSVQDAWAKGLRLGVVGGSDNHDLFMERGTALTAVLSSSLDRHAVFQALRNRRCYATTGERILLDFQVNGSPMGSVIRSKTAPVIRVKVTGTDSLEKVEIVKFRKGTPRPFPTVYAVDSRGNYSAFEWKDLAFDSDCAYYLRVTQRADPRITGKQDFGLASGFPNEMAWSSPVWVEKK